ncbi:hypothetical protein C4K03_0709 [Pseudomonas synxantha]|uniref:Uncharacterized protein n=1 Tax=Pseudomonas synxantha TaxID=47883 RepID=A0A3G7U0M9_9PSED|nr:hypothetical protein C4K03_0709 [Pseudomonas synxantha]
MSLCGRARADGSIEIRPTDSVKKPARASDAFCKLLHKSTTTIKYLFI